MSISLSIQPATLMEKTTVLLLFREMAEELERFGHDFKTDDESLEALWHAVFLPAIENGDPILIARYEGRTVGALFWVVYDAPWIETPAGIGYGMFVFKSWRGQGIARALVQKGKEILREKGIKKLAGTVSQENKASLRVLSKEGFKVEGFYGHYPV